ncbi:MAG: polyphosphate kinase 1 [Candidatus Eremiobacteraeota bacterium]|nr:polyphosphate kinase 1 [Candidatus Eremiobacteraeota bacterium]MBV8365872.1 polyphosphate kinase 1 [Candidatus Eremiobacteraeota bacterium]
MKYLNRDLSWLDFDDRVLALAENEAVPLLERVRFLAIFSRNLDEFFQVRIGGLQEQLSAGVGAVSSDGLTIIEQLDLVKPRVDELVARSARIFTQQLTPALEKAGIRFTNWDALGDADREHLDKMFYDQIFPVLTPLAVDPGHPFPYISNLSLNLAVVVADPAQAEPRIARLKVPPLLPRFVRMPDGERFVPIEQIIAAHLSALFPGMEVVERYVFRITRNADFALKEDEAEDLLEAVESVLRMRRRSPDAVRLEIEGAMSDSVRNLLARELELDDSDIYVVNGPLDLGGLWGIADLEKPALKYEPWLPLTPPQLASSPDQATHLFRVLRQGDILVHHPYDSFLTSVEAFVDQAARDPRVMAIKQTLYRTGVDSPIIKSLIRAAEAGKQVVALVEVTARFDEATNINFARALEEAGVHVVYGIVGLKTHAKITLVVRQERSGIKRYCHVGTGNYNPTTARLYEDIGILSADPALGSDLTELFNYLTGYSKQSRYTKLLVAPGTLRPALLELIKRETDAPDGRIVLKVNNLVDPTIIQALYNASSAGTQIDAVVRGICCLQPGVPGLSENIRVRSIVGRYLEHSRIMRFGSDERGADYFIGSADVMQRNLDRRVEAVIPVTDPLLQSRLQEILDVNLADDALAWTLDADGVWHKVPTVHNINTHRRLQELALARLQAHTPVDVSA